MYRCQYHQGSRSIENTGSVGNDEEASGGPQPAPLLGTTKPGPSGKGVAVSGTSFPDEQYFFTACCALSQPVSE